MTPESVESFDILIEFDVPLPPPAMHIPFKRTKWSHKLAPMRSHPGRRARIWRDIESAKKASGIKSNIKTALRKSDPYDKWTFNALKDDERGVWDIFATYEGRRTEAEYLQFMMAHEDMRTKQERQKLAAKSREAVQQGRRLGRTAFNPSLRPPTLDPD